MAKKLPQTTSVGVLQSAPSDELVSSFLRRLHAISGVDERTMEQWRTLEKTQPNLTRFIMACSYRAAPDDPEVREVIAANMLYLYILLGEAKLQEEVRNVFAGSFDDHFAAPKS
jgi:hypothetical protein